MRPGKIEILTHPMVKMQSQSRPTDQDETIQFRPMGERLPNGLSGFFEHG